MPHECPCCMEPMETPVTTACGHTFCTDCLAAWASMAITCPLCRCDLPPWLSRRVLNAARSNPQDQALEPVSIRERVEADEAERRPVHMRRLQRERRMVEYQVMTISGRPYEDLPIIRPQEMRDLFANNRRTLGMSLHSSLGSGLGCNSGF